MVLVTLWINLCILSCYRDKLNALTSFSLLEIMSMISDQNYLYYIHFEIENLFAQIQDFGQYKYFIDLLLSRFVKKEAVKENEKSWGQKNVTKLPHDGL